MKPSKQVLKHRNTDIIRKSISLLFPWTSRSHLRCYHRRSRSIVHQKPCPLPQLSPGTSLTGHFCSSASVFLISESVSCLRSYETVWNDFVSQERYLTLQFSRGGKNVICDEYFDHMTDCNL